MDKKNNFTVVFVFRTFDVLRNAMVIVQTGYDLNSNGDLSIRYKINDDGRRAVQNISK